MKREWWIVGVLISLALAGCVKRRAVSPAADRFAIAVTEKGFEPPVLVIPADRPVTLVVTRTTDYTCARDFIMASREIAQPLPLDQPVEIPLGPEPPGELSYACAVDMFRGVVRVR